MTHQQTLKHLHTIATEALLRWPIKVAKLQRIGHYENTVYDVFHTNGERFILRLHRPHYQSTDAIRTELTWLAALRDGTTLRVPEPVRGHDGAWLQEVDVPSIGRGRRCVLFKRLPGSVVGQRKHPRTAQKLGAMIAKLHAHSEHYAPEEGIARAVLDVDGCVGPQGIFGDPLAVPELSEHDRAIFKAACDKAREQLAGCGRGPDKFGLIHRDLHLNNVLIWKGELMPIDFDDCAVSYHAMDLAIALWGMGSHPNHARLRASLLKGYREIRTLSAEDEARIDAMITLHMLIGPAWINGRRDLPGMTEAIPRVIAETVRSAQLYLKGCDPLGAKRKV